MNLNKLFEIQSGLDHHIVKEKGLEGQDLLDKKILSLQVELGECANEWRGFKFWSTDQEPRTKVGLKSYYAAQQGLTKNPLLEEYVDCLHFILSIGLEKGFDGKAFPYLHENNYSVYTETDTVTQFKNTFYAISEFVLEENHESYEELFLYFIGLGKHLGFATEQIEQAYLDKNKINHERQLNGY